MQPKEGPSPGCVPRRAEPTLRQRPQEISGALQGPPCSGLALPRPQPPDASPSSALWCGLGGVRKEPPALTPGLSGSQLQPTHRGRWESHAPGRLALGVSGGGQGDPHPVLAKESRGLTPETPTHAPHLLLRSWAGCLDPGCCWGYSGSVPVTAPPPKRSRFPAGVSGGGGRGTGVGGSGSPSGALQGPLCGLPLWRHLPPSASTPGDKC